MLSVFVEICCLWPFLICQFWKDCIIVKFCGELDFFFHKCTVVCLSDLTCFVEDWWPVWCHVDMRKCLAVLHLSTWVPAAVYSQLQSKKSVSSCGMIVTLLHFTHDHSLLQPWTQGWTKRPRKNYCYIFTIWSSIRVEKKSSCDPPLLFYVL